MEFIRQERNTKGLGNFSESLIKIFLIIEMFNFYYYNKKLLLSFHVLCLFLFFIFIYFYLCMECLGKPEESVRPLGAGVTS